KFGGKYRIFIDNRQSKQKQWQDFGHELGHVLCHAGHQLKMNHMFLKYQEWKANNFMYHFCVSTFMLCQLKEVNVHNVMNLFNVEYEFACKSLTSYSFKKHIIKTQHLNTLRKKLSNWLHSKKTKLNQACVGCLNF